MKIRSRSRGKFHLWSFSLFKPDEEISRLCFTDRPIVSLMRQRWRSIREWSVLLPSVRGHNTQEARMQTMGEVFIDANIHLSRDHNTWNAFTDTKSYTMNKGCTANAATYNIFLFLVVVIRVILVQVAPQGWLLGLCFFGSFWTSLPFGLGL